GQNVYSLQLSYDVRGNISSKTETVSGTATTFDYTYDQDGQLVQVKKQGAIAENFAYDVNGNRTSYERPGQWTVTAGYDEQDRILQQGSVSYQFNADGQLAQRGSDAFLYSATGELLQSTANGDTIVYSYDGTGRRIARTDVSGTKQYLYSNLEQPFQLTAMRDTAGVLSYYYYDTNGHLFAFDKGDERFYVASDQLGTPKVVTDTTGTVVRQMEYDSYGMPTFDSNPAFEMPVGFAGGISDAKTGLVRFGYRDYEPETGRWTAKDPILFKGNQGNLYGYVSNDPINWIDPDGLQKWKVTNPEQHPGGQRHVHWGDDAKARNGGAVNEDGSTRHGCKPPRKVVDKIRALTGWALEDLGAMAPFFVLPGQQQMLDNLNNGMPIDHYPGKIY
ncbi:MAG TPA: RHS repeat-associated core domain-containing protein, partial [Geobacteraceae bacterium]|nr:RHS repeat-associated core domain-containing protein [Geobacteraceae bacterium]